MADAPFPPTDADEEPEGELRQRLVERASFIRREVGRVAGEFAQLVTTTTTGLAATFDLQQRRASVELTLGDLVAEYAIVSSRLRKPPERLIVEVKTMLAAPALNGPESVDLLPRIFRRAIESYYAG